MDRNVLRESNIQGYLIAEATVQGGVGVKVEAPGSAGQGDVLVALPGGRVGLCEVKRPGEAPRALQRARARQWRATGVFCSWAATKGQADRFLRALRMLPETSPGLLLEMHRWMELARQPADRQAGSQDEGVSR